MNGACRISFFRSSARAIKWSRSKSGTVGRRTCRPLARYGINHNLVLALDSTTFYRVTVSSPPVQVGRVCLARSRRPNWPSVSRILGSKHIINRPAFLFRTTAIRLLLSPLRRIHYSATAFEPKDSSTPHTSPEAPVQSTLEHFVKPATVEGANVGHGAAKPIRLSSQFPPFVSRCNT